MNAVAHQDYASNGSVQVMLFADRLEVWNPGRLPQSLTLAMLREPHGSVPGNPLLAEALYLAQYIERVGTGTRDMIRLCREAGLREPGFAQRDGFVTTVWREVPAERTPPVTPHVTPRVTPQVHPPVTLTVTTPVTVSVTRSVTPHETPYVTPHVPPHVAVLIRLLGTAGDLSTTELLVHLRLKDRKHLRERYLAPCLAGGWIAMTIPDKPRSREQRYRLTTEGAAELATLDRDGGRSR